MARRITEDGKCFRHVIVYTLKDYEPNKIRTVFFGPYDTPGKSKASGTVWLHSGVVVLERYTEVADTWTRI